MPGLQQPRQAHHQWRWLPRALALAWAWLVLLAWVAVPAAAASPQPGGAGHCPVDRPIRFGDLNWDSGGFDTALDRLLLERGYGCTTVAIPGTTVTLEAALANGDVDLLAEEWVGRSPAWNAGVASGQVAAVGRIITGAVEGIFVPDWLIHGAGAPAAGLARVDQLAEPRFTALFRDPEQPGKGRFLNCPSGWSCERVNTAKLKAYGLAGAYVDFRPGSGAALDAAITAAMLQHRPVLFYYFSPSTISGRFRLARLAEPPDTPACWADLSNPDGQHRVGCASPPAVITTAFNRRFLAQAPALGKLFTRVSLPADVISAQLADAARHQRSFDAQALAFLRANPAVWRAWLAADAAARLAANLARDTGADAAPGAFPASWVVSIRTPVNGWVAAFVASAGPQFRAFSAMLTRLTAALDAGLRQVPWWLIVAGFVAVTAWGMRRPLPPALVGVALLLIGVLGLWDAMLQTLTLMVIAVVIALVIALPTGIWAAKSRVARAAIMPLLDLMQTMPAFVYLIPALMLLGLGKAPAILAMVIYAAPPMVRFTELGIRGADREVCEAATAFGATPWQTLRHVELPLARASILAGLNQTIMMALAMVVTASMIGARGLGANVLNGIQSLDIGEGFEAGLAIVVLAVALDRASQAIAGRASPRAGDG